MRRNSSENHVPLGGLGGVIGRRGGCSGPSRSRGTHRRRGCGKRARKAVSSSTRLIGIMTEFRSRPPVVRAAGWEGVAVRGQFPVR